MTDIKNDERLKVNNTRGNLHRISADQFELGRELLRQVALQIEPNNQTQRQIFSRYLPDIYYLRISEECTFKSITGYLKEIGMNLSESSVRVYYSKMLPKRMQECINTAKELHEHYQSVKEKNRFSIDKDQ